MQALPAIETLSRWLRRAWAGVLTTFIGVVACTRPAERSPENLSRPLPAFDLQGHRGARGLMPENTVPAFLKALELGVTTLEMDLVVSADGQLIVSHEPFFNPDICTDQTGAAIPRTDPPSPNLYALTAAEIAAFDCGHRPHPHFPEQQPRAAHKPTLGEVVAAVAAYEAQHNAPPVRYNVEIKSTPAGDDLYHPAPEVFAQLVYDQLRALNLTDRAFVQSFDVRALQAMRRLAPGVPLALLVEDSGSLDFHLARLGFVPAVYSPHFPLLDSATVVAAHARGLRVVPWTVNDPADMARLVGMGVDGLITDYPDRYQTWRAAQPQP